MQNSDVPPPAEDLSKWEAEFNALMSSQREDDYDYGASFQGAWQNGTGDFSYDAMNFSNGGETIQFDAEGLPLLSSYDFGA